MAGTGVIDCHAHIIDPARFPFAGSPGYKPRPHEAGPREAYCAVLDQHGVSHALLVQPSGYGYDNTAMLDALTKHKGRFKGVAVAAPETPDRDFAAWAAAGVVGLRFNLVSSRPDALSSAGGRALLDHLTALGWFAQVYCEDEQWPETAAILRESGIRVVIDHFGVRNLAGGVRQKGFQAVLGLGRDGRSAVKLSGGYRISQDPPTQMDLDPFAAALREVFGPDACVWASDWPFLNVPTRPDYAATLAPLRRWIPDEVMLKKVLWHTPSRLFGFTHEAGSHSGDAA